MFNFIKIAIAFVMVALAIFVTIVSGLVLFMSLSAWDYTGQLDLLTGICVISSGGVLIGACNATLKLMGD